MSSDSVVRARIDSDTKARATAALDAMGLSVSDAIRLLMLRIADEQRLPFSVQVPNAKTMKAMKAMEELEAGQGKRFNNEQDLFDDLGCDTDPGAIDAVQKGREKGPKTR
jgi:DNA-damage-inducible protein J